MTLFTLLIIMALERVVPKTKAWHITTLAQRYFSKTGAYSSKQKEGINSSADAGILKILLIAGIPAIGIWLLVAFLPGIIVFFLYLVLLWICLGCPVTRETYKRYLQAASREDFEACSLYSEKFGNQGSDLSNVGKQLILVNYRQYASVIIFFVVLGLPGMVFYSLCKEWYLAKKEQTQVELNAELTEPTSDESDELTDKSKNMVDEGESGEEKLMFVLDWIPARITAFGFLLVGHFSKGLPVWLNTFLNPTLSTYDVLAKVAKSSEDLTPSKNPNLQEPLQMVKLAKRNIVFLLMVISVMTLVGAVG